MCVSLLGVCQAERKVQNKYIPPDFDPAKLRPGFGSKTNKCEVRTMLPWSVQCNTCGNYMYAGKKFNSRMRDVGERYLGIRMLRFIMKCSNCNAEFSIRTDPKNSDYATEWGVTRNFEPWRDKEDALARERAEKEEEEKNDALQALESRTLASKRQMDIHDALDEAKSIKQRQERVNTDDIITSLRQGDAPAEDEDAVAEEDLAELHRFQEARRKMLAAQAAAAADGAAGAGAPSAALVSVTGMGGAAAGAGTGAGAGAGSATAAASVAGTVVSATGSAVGGASSGAGGSVVAATADASGGGGGEDAWAEDDGDVGAGAGSVSTGVLAGIRMPVFKLKAAGAGAGAAAGAGAGAASSVSGGAAAAAGVVRKIGGVTVKPKVIVKPVLKRTRDGEPAPGSSASTATL